MSDLRDWAIDHNCVDTVNHLHAMADSSEELLNLSVESVKDEKDWVYRVIERRLWSRFARQVSLSSVLPRPKSVHLFTFDSLDPSRMRQVARSISSPIRRYTTLSVLSLLC